MKPRVELPLTVPAAEGRWGMLRVEAAVARDEDALFDTFDANLIQAGLLPVNVRFTNEGQQPAVVEKTKTRLTTTAGRSFRRLSASSAFKQLLSFYGISTYNKHGYKVSKEDFSAYEFDWKTPLGPGESRTGFIFFQVPPDAAVPLRLVLSFKGIAGGPERGELELNLSSTL